MKNLTMLHSNIDSLLVSYNIDHNVRNDVKRLMERKDSEYISIDRALEIISKEEEEFEQGYALDVSKYGFACAASLIREKVLALKGGEQEC